MSFSVLNQPGATLATLRAWGEEMLGKRADDPSAGEVPPQGARFEVDTLLCEVLGWNTARLYTRLETPVEEACSCGKGERFISLLQRRAAGEPLAYILGYQPFHNGEVIVTPDVLIPRPETELLVEQVLALFSESTPPFFLADIGTGSGAILGAVLRGLEARFGEEYLNRGVAVAVDKSMAALQVAQRNLASLPAQLVCGDLLSAFLIPASHTPALHISALHISGPDISVLDSSLYPQRGLGVFVANLPYIPNSEELPHSVRGFEPPLALFGGEEGTEVIAEFLSQLSQVLFDEVHVLLEVGAGQAERVGALVQGAGFSEIEFIPDYRNILRIVRGRKLRGRNCVEENSAEENIVQGRKRCA